MLGRLAGRFVDGFITEAIRDKGPDAVRRAGAVIWLTFAMTLVSALGMAEMAARGAYSLMGMLAVMLLISFTCPFLLKRTGSVQLVGSIVLTCLFIGVIVMAWRAGGLGAPVLYTLTLAPFLATLGVQRNTSLLWGMLSVVVVVAFTVLNATNAIPPTTVDHNALMRGHTLILLVVILITLGGARVYERLREEELVQLTVAQQQAEAAQQRAEAANRAKRDFLANVSHEIRTPMTGVMTASAMLVSMPLDKDAQELADLIHKSADALLVVMDDMLDFARLEEGRVTLTHSPFDVSKTVQSVVKLMAPDAGAKGLTLNAVSAEEQGSFVLGDEARIRQILVNLVSNAIKFTDDGSVEVALAIESEGERARIQIEVTDTGIGMTQSDLQRVFERFERIEEQGGARRRGTGLGLAISRQLAELMGGTLEATSARGEGSCFTLCLLLPTAAEVTTRDVLADEGSFSAKVLLAEDNPVNRRICSMMLERLGCDVHLAANGRKAVKLAAERRYDLILMDCFMPEMDGLTAARKIRAYGGELARLPIVAFTAAGTEQDRQACAEAGMNDIITKPVQLKRLSAVLRRWTEAERPAPDSQGA